MRRNAPIVLISLACSLLTLCLYHYLVLPQITAHQGQFIEPIKASYDTPLNSKPFFAPPVENEKFINISETAINGVVSVKATKLKESGFFRDKYAKTNGSGVILSEDGFIVTNYHVIQDAADIDVRLEDKREYKAEMVGFDLATDIALIKIEAENLFHLEFGNSDSLRVGEWVLAVGNPFKLQSSVTAGIVSAKGRNINIFDRQGIESFIQTDAAINPGNSGGALINTNGKVVGINTAILTYSGKYEGFSFAVPSNLVNKIVKDIRNYGAVQRAWLGVSVFDIDNDKADDLGLDFIGGVLLDVVDKNGSAANAGMRSEDVIISINDSKTLTTSEFLEVLGRYSPGDQVKVEYVRKSKLYTTTATLRNQLNTTDFVAVRKDKILTDLGFELRDMNTLEKDRLEEPGAIVISIYRDSKIASTNMDPGYIITSVNDDLVRNVDEFIEAYKNASGEIWLNGYYETYPGEWPYKFNK